MRLILASASPRRRDLLTLLGLPFDIMPSDVPELPKPGEAPREYALRLSGQKAASIAGQISGEALILASDTIVVSGERILEKPLDAADAAIMLQSLRGHTHHVYTSFTLLCTSDQRQHSEVVGSPVTMRDYTDDEIAAYVRTGDPFDKAGSYAIQHTGFRPVTAFNHCFANVMGLPLCHITRALREFGVIPAVDVPSSCQSNLDYACPVYTEILR